MDEDNWPKVVKVVSPGIRKMEVRNVSFVCSILFFTYLTINLCPSKLSAYDLWLPKVVGLPHIWWIQVSRQCHWRPRNFSEKRIRVGKEEDGTSALNQAYDKFQANQDKAQTRQLLYFLRQNTHGQTNQCQIIIIISTSIQNIPTKVWIDSFVAVNLHPRHQLTFPDWIKKISPPIKTG